MEDPERRDQVRKRRKWKQNLKVFFTDEEDQSSDSDVQNKITSIFETNDAIALRFPYPMVSDDSDDQDNKLIDFPRVLPNTILVNKYIEISSDDNIEPSQENKSYKHKKRKSFQQENLKITRINNVQAPKSATRKDSALVTNIKQRSNQNSVMKNSSHDSTRGKCQQYRSNSSRSCNIPKTENNCAVIKKEDTSKTHSSKILNSETEDSWNNTQHNPKQVSQTSLSVKRKSVKTGNKRRRNEGISRFLDSSSEEEEEEVDVKKPVRGNSSFKRIHLISSSSISSDNEELINKLKKQRTHFLSSSSDNEESIKHENNDNQTQKPAPDISETKIGLRKNHSIHSMSSSSDSEDSEKLHFVLKKNNYKSKVPVKKTLLLRSSKEESNKSPVSQNNPNTEDNVNPDKVYENKAQKTESSEMVQCKPNLNTDAWKNIATFQFKPPKSSSTHQLSYLQKLKKQFISSNTPSVEINRKINDKTIDKKDCIKSSKESYSSKSNAIKKDIAQGERLNPSYPPKLSGEKSTLDNNQDKSLPIDFNINMDVQITCSSSFVENVKSTNRSISKPPAENKNEAICPELDISLSLTHKQNKKTEISSSTNTKLSCTAERNSSDKTKRNDSSKLKCNAQHQLELSKYNQTQESGLKEDLINTGKKVNKSESRRKGFSKQVAEVNKEKNFKNSESRKEVFPGNNESENDLLNSILLEMDNNPFNVKKVLPKEVLVEPPAEMYGQVSLTSHIHPTPSQSHLPVKLLSPEKVNEAVHHQFHVENKVINNESRKKVFTESNECENDLLNSIFLEMDSNPFNVKKVFPKKALEPSAGKHRHVSLTPSPNFLSTLSQSDSTPPEKEKESNQHQSQEEHKFPDFSKQTSVAVSSGNSNENLQQLKQHETRNKQNSLEKSTKTPPSTVITSFYSVNSEDYNRPHEVSNDQNIESNTHLIPSTSNQDHMSHKVLYKNSKSSRFTKVNERINSKKESRITEVHQLSPSVSNAISTIHDHRSSQHNLYKNSIERRDRLHLENNTSADKNLKYIELVQSTIDTLTQLLPKKNPSISDKRLVDKEMKTVSIPKSDSQLENTGLNSSKEPTTHFKIGMINHCTARNKEVEKCPDKESNIILDSEPPKGIRIRLGGNVYRLAGKENVIDSNIKEKKQKEIILSTIADSKTHKATNISFNNSINSNNVSSPCTSNKARKSEKSSSSSEDSSDDSSSSEDRLVVSEKSSSGNSSLDSTSEDKKEVSDVQNMKPSSKVLAEGKVNNDKEAKEENINLKTTGLGSIVSELNDPPKYNKKSFSLDQLLGFHEKNKTKASSSSENSCNVISDDAIVLSSSSEGESVVCTNNSASKCKSLEQKDSSVLDETSQNNSTKTSVDKSKDQNPNLKDQIVDKGWKIRVRSLEELGVSNACSLPDNALQPPRLVAVEPKEQTFEAQPVSTLHALDVLNPAISEKIDFVAKKKSTVKRKATLLKEETKRQKLKGLHLLQNESNKTVTESNVNKFNSSAKEKHLPKTKKTSIDKFKTNFSSKQNYNTSANKVSSKESGVLKQTIASQFNAFKSIDKSTNISQHPQTIASKFNAFKSIDKSTNKLLLLQSEAIANQTTQRSSETAYAVVTPLVWGITPIGTSLNMVREPIESYTTTENSTGTAITSAPCSVSNKCQYINKPPSELTGKSGSIQTPNPEESINPITPENLESQFFKLCDNLFCEVVMMKIPKLVDDLHLVITHDIMREERLKKVEQLKCPETKEEEKRRTKKEFADMLKIRSQGFVPLFMTIVRMIKNKENMRTLVIALYCKIIHQLEHIDQINSAYRFKLRVFIHEMLLKNNINHEVCAIFGDSHTSFPAHFYFIENLLRKYDQFVINCNNIGIQNAPQVSKTTSYVVYCAEPSTSKQTAVTIHKSNHNNLQAQASGMSNVNLILPVGNLDEMLLGSFLKKANGPKS